MKSNFWIAVFALVGTTIGAGIFGLPYVFSKAGFLLGFLELLLLVFVVALIQQILGEIALRTPGRARLVSYAAGYLGYAWRTSVMISVLLGGIGVMLVYIILGGEFLGGLIGRSAFDGSVAFFAVWFLAVLMRPRTFGRAEFYVSFAVILIIVLISLFNAGYVDLNNFKNFNLKNVLLPYGVILFAITGYTVIPEMEDILGSEKRRLRKAVIYGTLIPPLVYLIFIFAVLGVSGPLTSPEAVSGLAKTLNSAFILKLGSFLGLLAVFGAALSHGVYLKETLWYDLKLNKWLSWVLTGAAPLLLFLAGARGFIEVIGLVGALFFGFQAAVILMIHRKAKTSEIKPAYEINLPEAVYYALGAFVILGALLEVWYSLS